MTAMDAGSPQREREDEARFVDLAFRNPNNEIIVRRLAELDLPDGHLVSDCLFQTVWAARWPLTVMPW
ncbi:MAG TPA: hypothetical protein VFG38_11680 [Pseudomonadales bacterium]|nr:hypothetical protein [Pseudomonadales bacterium]